MQRVRGTMQKAGCTRSKKFDLKRIATRTGKKEKGGIEGRLFFKTPFLLQRRREWSNSGRNVKKGKRGKSINAKTRKKEGSKIPVSQEGVD